MYLNLRSRVQWHYTHCISLPENTTQCKLTGIFNEVAMADKFACVTLHITKNHLNFSPYENTSIPLFCMLYKLYLRYEISKDMHKLAWYSSPTENFVRVQLPIRWAGILCDIHPDTPSDRKNNINTWFETFFF